MSPVEGRNLTHSKLFFKDSFTRLLLLLSEKNPPEKSVTMNMALDALIMHLKRGLMTKCSNKKQLYCLTGCEQYGFVKKHLKYQIWPLS